MGYPTTTNAQFLTAAIRDEFEDYEAQVSGFLSREHDSDGTHGDVTSESLTTEIVTAESVHVAGVQSGGPESGTGNIVLGDQPAVSAAIGGYGLKLGRWRIVEDRVGAARDLLFQSPDLLNEEFIMKLGVSGASTWALFAGLTAGLDIGTAAKRILQVEANNVHANLGYTERGRTTKLGEWQYFTPSWTAVTTNPAIGNGTISGRYTEIGTTVHFGFIITMGSTTTFGTGDYRFGLPVAAQGDLIGTCHGHARDNDTGVRYLLGTGFVSSTLLAAFVDVSTANFSPTVPFTWATSDTLRIAGSYEKA